MLIDRILHLHRDVQLDDRTVIVGLRAWLKFTEPSGEAVMVADAANELERSLCGQTAHARGRSRHARGLRRAGQLLVDQANSYGSDKAQPDAFLRYLLLLQN